MMKKKKLFTLVAAIALVGAVGVGATLAYFTDSEEANNVVTMGHVDVELTEPNFDGDENNEMKNLTPGEVVTKDPTITLAEGSQDAYIRATLSVTGYEDILDASGAPMDIDELTFNISDTDWVLGADGYYYYQTKLTADNNTAVLFDTVSIPESWGNEVADKSFHIDVMAEAIQADNFDPHDVDGVIRAWKYADGSAITAEGYVAAQN